VGTAERRLAALLLTDMPGAQTASSSVWMRDQAKTMVRAEVARFAGRVIKCDDTDCLAEFASAVQAVRSGLAIQERMEGFVRARPGERIPFPRIGVELGEIELAGTEVVGSTIQSVELLRGLAPRGTVCIADYVLQTVRGKVGAKPESVGEQQLPPLTEPVQIFSLEPATERLTTAGHLVARPPSSKKTTTRLMLAMAAIAVVVGALTGWLVTRLR
jgi:class 3 adenylate cyclase